MRRVRLERFDRDERVWVSTGLDFNLDKIDMDELQWRTELVLDVVMDRQIIARLIRPGCDVGDFYFTSQVGWHIAEPVRA